MFPGERRIANADLRRSDERADFAGSGDVQSYRPRSSHHPATASTQRSRSTLDTSNHSDMAAQ